MGKIKEDVPSSAKLIAVVGSQALNGSSSNDIILNNESFVNNNSMQDSGNNSNNNNGTIISLSVRFNKDEKNIRFSVPSLQEVDSYTEEQYNNFRWVRANNVLSSTEYETLLSRYADYKHNKDKYPTTGDCR